LLRVAVGFDLGSDSALQQVHERHKPGSILTLQVDRAGWVIHQPVEGAVRIPTDPNRIIDIRLVPKGSQRLWTHDHVESLIAEMIFAARGQIASDSGLNAIDFGTPIQNWADRYGFDAEAVQKHIDRWSRDVEQSGENPYRMGLAAFAQNRLGEAERLLARSGEEKRERLEQLAATRDVPALQEEIVRDFRLAGDCAYANYRFAQARDHYRAALSQIDRAEHPELSAMTLHDLAAANYEIAIRAGAADAPTHMRKTLDALKSALALQSREAMPLEWTQTQAMLLRVHEDLGDATGMAQVLAELLDAEPDNRDYYKLSHALNHEVLFDFENAHRQTLAWLERYPDDLDALCNLAETHFTTGRFAQAATHLKVLLESGQLQPEIEAAMRLVKIANLLAMGDTDEVPVSLDGLRALVDAQPEGFNVGWAFEGSSHFIGQHTDLEEHRGMLFGLLWAAETGKRGSLLTAVDAARAALSPNR
jgi:hypothetical protein